MNSEIKIIIFSVVLVLFASFMIFGQQGGITGLAVLDGSGSTVKQNDSKIYTESEAIAALNNARIIMAEMQSLNFSVEYINDTLQEAEIVYEQLKYVEVLKNLSATQKEKAEASKALSLVNWKALKYSDVIYYTDLIIERQKQALEINDKIIIYVKRNSEYASQGINVSQSSALIENVKGYFSKGQYTDAFEVLKKIETTLESERQNRALVSGIIYGARNFFRRYWIEIVVAIALIFVIGRYVLKKTSRARLVKKIKKMKFEKKSLKDLIVRAQIERYKENKISGLVYNIRLKKYNERIGQIEESIPVLEARLKKM